MDTEYSKEDDDFGILNKYVLPDDPHKLFELQLVLGKGTYGTVYKARNKITNEIVAAKVLLPDTSNISELIEEVSILQKFYNNRIVRYYGTYLHDPEVCWVWMCSAIDVAILLLFLVFI